MSSRIDRIRRTVLTNQAARAGSGDEAPSAKVVNLPVPVQAAPPKPEDADASAAFAAQLMGQDGQKRGLRAGPSAIDQARGAYNKIEWSGSKDRRARKGGQARTEI
jgi:hypothetical protein